jgi:hypothetical protein
VLRPDGSLLIPLHLVSEDFGPGWFQGFAVLKVGPDGKVDRSYGDRGLAVVARGVAPVPDDIALIGFAVEPNGRAVALGPGSDGALSLVRFLPDGQRDESYGPDGRRRLANVGVSTSAGVVPGPDGSFVVPYAFSSGNQFINSRLMRFLPGGEPDGRFDTAHTGLIFGSALTTLVDNAGSVLVAANVPDDYLEWYGGYWDRDAVARFSSTGERDMTFGPVPPGARFVEVDYPWTLPGALMADGASGFVLGSRSGVARLDSRGVPDLRFGNAGRAFVGGTASAHALLQDGAVLVVAGVPQEEDLWSGGPSGPWRMGLFRLRSTWEAGTGDVTVVEYFNAGLGHYFVTSSVEEQQRLDAGGDWRRTGLAFRAWSSAGSDRVPMLRYFSGAMFEPKSSHFYTYLQSEWNALREQGLWRYEGTAFAVRLLEGDLSSRSCASGAVPLYRLYNNSQGGAPNHRYTTDPTVVDQMIASGWIPEGEDARGRFACVAER